MLAWLSVVLNLNIDPKFLDATDLGSICFSCLTFSDLLFEISDFIVIIIVDVNQFFGGLVSEYFEVASSKDVVGSTFLWQHQVTHIVAN